MKTEIETIAGDTPGISYELVIHRLTGTDAEAPSAYIQAGLHANERPGPAAMHYLIPMLVQAESEGCLRGSLTLVPQANPIAAAQHLFGDHMGRFSTGTRINFNRNFPVPDESGPHSLPRVLHAKDAPVLAEQRLKSRLLDLADDHPIVLDLHCDDESVQYLYAPQALWPQMSDLAACLDAKVAVLWSVSLDHAFEEAAFAQIKSKAMARAIDGDLTGKCVTTVELGGLLDVDPAMARQDAQGLFRFLAMRGIIAVDENVSAKLKPDFIAKPIHHAEMIRAPAGGTILFHVSPGERVTKDQLLAEIVIHPGMSDGAVGVYAPQSGYVLTRRMRRFIRMGDDLIKLIGDEPSANAKDGTLED